MYCEMIVGTDRNHL